MLIKLTEKVLVWWYNEIISVCLAELGSVALVPMIYNVCDISKPNSLLNSHTLCVLDKPFYLIACTSKGK